MSQQTVITFLTLILIVLVGAISVLAIYARGRSALLIQAQRKLIEKEETHNCHIKWLGEESKIRRESGCFLVVMWATDSSDIVNTSTVIARSNSLTGARQEAESMCYRNGRNSRYDIINLAAEKDSAIRNLIKTNERVIRFAATQAMDLEQRFFDVERSREAWIALPDEISSAIEAAQSEIEEEEKNAAAD